MSPDEAPTRSSAHAAIVVASLAAMVLGIAVGDPLPTLSCVLGAAIVAAGGARFDDGAIETRAAGAVAIPIGAIVLAGSLFAFSPSTPLVVGAAGLAVIVVDLDATTGFTWADTAGIDRTIRRSLIVLVLAIVVATAHHVGVFTTGVTGAIAAWVGIASASLLGSFVLLQVELLVAIELIDRAIPSLKGWLSTDEWREMVALERLRIENRDRYRKLWIAVLGEAFLALLPGVREAFAAAVATLSGLGVVVRLLLGVWIHVAMGAVILVPTAILVGDLLRAVVVTWIGARPPKAVAHVAGGVTAAVVGLSIVAVPRVGRSVATATPESVVTLVGSGTIVLAGVVVALVVLWIVLATMLFVEGSKWIPDRTGGFALGSGLLVLAAVSAGVRDATAPLVFAAFAGAVLVWDFGEYATTHGATVPEGTPTRRAEVVHVFAGLLVAAAGVVLATVGAYVVVPAATIAGVGTTGGWQSFLALVLAVIALFLFVLSLRIEKVEDDESPSTSGTQTADD